MTDISLISFVLSRLISELGVLDSFHRCEALEPVELDAVLALEARAVDALCLSRSMLPSHYQRNMSRSEAEIEFNVRANLATEIKAINEAAQAIHDAVWQRHVTKVNRRAVR